MASPSPRPVPGDPPSAADGDDDDGDLPTPDDGSAPPGADAPPAEAVERRETVVAADLHRARLDHALVALAPEFSRSHLQSLIEAGHASLDGRVQRTASKKVVAGQRLAVELVPTDESRAFRPEPMVLAVVFEDAHLLVVDKPAGLVVHPAAGHWQGTLMNGLLAWHAGASLLPRAGIVHRLDKDTSGLMVVAKTLTAMTTLVRVLAAREVKREYVALAHGVWPQGRQRIDAPVGRDPRSRVRMAVVASGRAAQTDVERVAVGAAEDGRPVSAVRCTLQTGRTHQIRVHLASRGHPLVGDVLYGGAPALGMIRQALHARRLGFAHPHSGEALVFEAPPPADLAAAWRAVVGDVDRDAGSGTQ